MSNHPSRPVFEEPVKPQLSNSTAIYLNGQATALPAPAHPVTNATNPQDQIRLGQWSAGLFDCFDFCVPNGLMAWCCTFITLAQVTSRLAVMPYRTALAVFFFLAITSNLSSYIPDWRCPDDEDDDPRHSCSPTLAWICLVVYCVAWIAQTFFVTRLRRHIRQRFQLPGDMVGDVFLSCCCTCCAAAQMATHVKSYQPGDCRLGAPPVLPASDQLPGYQA